ncbi:Gfo/Idh/MocA family protein [Mucilaginibacter psychrotolerans]|uniref:Gfo/Idh/MocA family oxidoreductase n=1 Tax=Mucilaginibacter psychrotolerans TaxID=1524096 RepID=A0A4Y8SFY7_9SPHI|nr:Gfo/Idh/MocA family oxidoreductase [Mucilaginibacter psychrotolerans]TFF37983.1 Gfo/Idh/MocA family oxidoreductase [Mucilaginibacter psychrotolerans]
MTSHSPLTSNHSPIKWGIIGCGRIAHRFMLGLNSLPDNVLSASWSRRAETVDAFVAQYGGLACTSVEDLLASDIDAVYIATLPNSHAEYCIKALNAGKPVLCEKPATLNLPELDEVLAVAREKKLLFMEGMKPPFFPLYRKLTEYVAKDPIGRVAYVRAGSSVADIDPSHPNFSYELAGGSLMGIAIYEAYLAIAWLGEAKEIQAMGYIDDTQIDMFSIFQSRHQHGYAQVYCGFDLHGKGDALICGTLGNVTIHKNWWNPAKATINYLDGRTVVLDEPFTDGGLNYEIAHFAELLRAGEVESPIIPYAMSRGMIGMIDEARKQVGLKFIGE